MRRAVFLCTALLIVGSAAADPMKIVEPDDGRASDQYWSPGQRVTPGRHLMEKRAPIGSAISENGEAGWAGPVRPTRPSPVVNPEAPETKQQIRQRVMSAPRLQLNYFISERLLYDYRDECFVIAARAKEERIVDLCIRDEENSIKILNRDWLKLTPGERRDCANLTYFSKNSSPDMSITAVAGCVSGSVN